MILSEYYLEFVTSNGDLVGATAEFPQQAPEFEGGDGLLANGTDHCEAPGDALPKAYPTTTGG